MSDEYGLHSRASDILNHVIDLSRTVYHSAGCRQLRLGSFEQDRRRKEEEEGRNISGAGSRAVAPRPPAPATPRPLRCAHYNLKLAHFTAS